VELYGLPGAGLEGLVVEGMNGANGAVGPLVEFSGVTLGGDFFVVADEGGDGANQAAGVGPVLNFDFQNGPDSSVGGDSTHVQGR
jgi:hypothetical protein